MIVVTRETNFTEEIPAENYKNKRILFDAFQPNNHITSIFIPKEVENIYITFQENRKFLDRYPKLILEEGLNSVFIKNYKSDTIKIPLSCTEFGLSNSVLNNLFVPENVNYLLLLDMDDLKTMKEYEYNSEDPYCINYLWLDGKYTEIVTKTFNATGYDNYKIYMGFYKNFTGHSYYRNDVLPRVSFLRLHPSYMDYLNRPFKFYYDDSCGLIACVNQPSKSCGIAFKDNNYKKNIILETIHGNITEKIYYEKYGPGKCTFMPDYSNISTKDLVNKIISTKKEIFEKINSENSEGITFMSADLLNKIYDVYSEILYRANK